MALGTALLLAAMAVLALSLAVVAMAVLALSSATAAMVVLLLELTAADLLLASLASAEVHMAEEDHLASRADAEELHMALTTEDHLRRAQRSPRAARRAEAAVVAVISSMVAKALLDIV